MFSKSKSLIWFSAFVIFTVFIFDSWNARTKAATNGDRWAEKYSIYAAFLRLAAAGRSFICNSDVSRKITLDVVIGGL